MSTLAFRKRKLAHFITRTLHWLCALVFEIFYLKMRKLQNKTRLFTEKHPYPIKGQLFKEFDCKNGKRTKTYVVEISFLSKRRKKSGKHQKFRPFV